MVGDHPSHELIFEHRFKRPKIDILTGINVDTIKNEQGILEFKRGVFFTLECFETGELEYE